MIAIFDLIDAVGRDGFIAFLAVFVRVGGAIALLPAFGERAIPERIRLVLAIAFSILVAPMVFPVIRPLIEAETGLGFLVFEVIAGLAIGISVRLLIMALQTAGSIAAQSTSLSQIFGGSATDPQPAIGHILFVGGLCLAVMMGLHVKLLSVFVLSYDVFVPGGFFEAGVFSDWGILQIGKSFSLAFSLAAPFMIASLIYNVALGVINRAMPQLMVAFVGAPAITAGGLILLAIIAPLLFETWRAAFLPVLDDPFGAR
ncbi:MAG: flagellar biosynthetic protein FliR [Maritimibacter sp.]